MSNFISNKGKITIFTIVLSCIVLFAVAYVWFWGGGVERANADQLTTSITVLNTPPTWFVDAEEQTESSAANPTNSGGAVTWVATADDSNNEDYYLLVCKTNTTPTANSSAPPTCGGGVVNEWAVSILTTDQTQASAATTTLEVWTESNDWYAWICDANASLPRCNTTFKQGTGTTASPFVVNHPPLFQIFIDDSPADPGAIVTWMATSSDSDILGGADTVRLFVCKAADFTGTACGVGGTWASSTLVASDPNASTTIAIPTQDQNYTAFGYVVDSHNNVATSSIQGTDSTLVVSNVAPSVTASTISLYDTDDVGNLELLVPNGTTSPFKVRFTAVDNNSCQNASAGDEIVSAVTNVYRSGIGQVACDVAGEFNANNCYTGDSSLWNVSCSQDGASCSGATDSDATWTCTFPLWYIADPTDGVNLTDSTWFAENWLASVQLGDDNLASSTLTEATTGNELISFLAFDVATTTIIYNSLEPGQQNDPIIETTDLQALGNVGLDENLYGDTMCTTWTAPDSCDPIDATGDIPVGEQVFATSSVTYAVGTALTASSSPTELEIDVPKTTSTSSPVALNTFWGIRIPPAITLAGDYQGQNTITAIKGEAQAW